MNFNIQPAVNEALSTVSDKSTKEFKIPERKLRSANSDSDSLPYSKDGRCFCPAFVVKYFHGRNHDKWISHFRSSFDSTRIWTEPLTSCLPGPTYWENPDSDNVCILYSLFERKKRWCSQSAQEKVMTSMKEEEQGIIMERESALQISVNAIS